MLLRPTQLLLRRGKPRPRAGMFPDKYRRVPALLKPQQGGQQYFSELLTQAANDELVREQELMRGTRGGITGSDPAVAGPGAVAPAGGADGIGNGIHPLLPQSDVAEALERTTAERIQAEMAQLIANDGFTEARGFNERSWYESEKARLQQQPSQSTGTTGGPASALPERVLGDDYFRSRYGYSLMKAGAAARGADAFGSGDATTAAVNYAQLDLWGEMPRYRRDMVFLYLISRRRNTYAVAYDYEGKRLLNTYTAGNRGLKGGDRGFRGDGSTDNGHQVASMYLNDLLPRIREQRAAAGRPLAQGEKVELVVRVMGFYNGRQGAVRAVQDRSSDFTVRYLEDITPFPLNGPKMPRGVFS